MDLDEAMRSTPTTRRFMSLPVDPDSLHRALDAARFAPSGGNRQPWRVIAVRDAAIRRRLRDLYLPGWEAYLRSTGAAPVLAEPSAPSESVVRRLRAADDFARALDEVPLHLVVLVELGSLALVDSGLERPSIAGGASIYPFVQNLLLALRAEGLGTAMNTILAAAEVSVRELLGFPADLAIAAHVVVGHREGGWPRRLARRAVEDFTFAERWGEPWDAERLRSAGEPLA